MTAADLVCKMLACEHADVLRESPAWLVAELMKAEVGGLTGAGLAEHAPIGAPPKATAIQPRRWDIRVWELELAKLRQGSHLPSFLCPRWRANRPWVAVVQEAFLNGISNQQGWRSG